MNLNCEDAIDKEIIVESLFRETTRNGKHTLRLVLLALTRNVLIIASSHSYGVSTTRLDRKCQNILEIQTLHPLHLVNLSIFKKSKRQTLKLCFHNKYERYFELERSCATDETWTTWCKQVLCLKPKKFRKRSKKHLEEESTSYDEDMVNKQWLSQKLAWKNKHLYMGSKREIEDRNRPIPAQGPSEDIKSLELNIHCFGYRNMTEQWVQCDNISK